MAELILLPQPTDAINSYHPQYIQLLTSLWWGIFHGTESV